MSTQQQQQQGDTSQRRQQHRPSEHRQSTVTIGNTASVGDVMSRRISQQHRPSFAGFPEDGGHRPSFRKISQALMLSSGSRRSSRYQRPSYAGSSLYGSSHLNAGREVAYENSYQLAPHAWERFSPCRAHAIIEQVLQSYLDGETYEAPKCASMSLHLSDIIKERIKSDLNNPPANVLDKAPKSRAEDGKLVIHVHPRYRVVCTVVIGQLIGQSVRIASRCMWDPSADNFASASYQNSSLFATATVFAIYFE